MEPILRRTAAEGRRSTCNTSKEVAAILAVLAHHVGDEKVWVDPVEFIVPKEAPRTDIEQAPLPSGPAPVELSELDLHLPINSRPL